VAKDESFSPVVIPNPPPGTARAFHHRMFIRLLPKIIPLALLAFGVWWFVSSRPVHHAPGVLVSKNPVQKEMAPRPLVKVDKWQLTAMAEYHLRGVVLGRKRYYGGQQSELVPVDVAVGWGRMSDQSVVDRLGISMGNRFYFYEWENEPPIPQDEIRVSSANNHVIAANSDVRKVIGNLRAGQIVTMHGYLVNAEGPDGRSWHSSLTRSDSGNGACELFYVESARAVNELADEM
jgi:hypothetical protein